MSAQQRIGLVAPLPPQTGGVASFAQWLLDHADELGVRFEPFDLHRPPDAAVGGRLRNASWGRQSKQLLRFSRWIRGAPRVVHYCVSLSATGLPRDLLFVTLLRLSGRRTIAHVHGPAKAGGPNARQRVLLGLLGRLSARRVAVLQLDGWSFVANPLRLVPGESRRTVRDGPLAVLAVGAYGRAKGSDVLVLALAQLRERGIPAVLTFVGQALEPGDELELRHLVGELELADAVTFAGVLGGEGVAQAYLDADVFSLPSEGEGLPMALLEAMAFGVPVVATTVGSIPAVVEDWRSGLLVAPGDVRGLANALARLADDTDLRNRLGEAGARRARTIGDPPTIAATWRRIYGDLA